MNMMNYVHVYIYIYIKRISCGAFVYLHLSSAIWMLIMLMVAEASGKKTPGHNN